MGSKTHAQASSPVQPPQLLLLPRCCCRQQLFLLLRCPMKSNGADYKRENPNMRACNTAFAYELPFRFSLLLVHCTLSLFFGIHFSLVMNCRLFDSSRILATILFVVLLTVLTVYIVTFVDLDFVYAYMHAFDRHKMGFKNIERL